MQNIGIIIEVRVPSVLDREKITLKLNNFSTIDLSKKKKMLYSDSALLEISING